MPVYSIGGADAVLIRKANKAATWENRAGENRVEPITRPGFEVPFKFKKHEKIFTIGSCFARHIEGELLGRGFKIPVRDMFKVPEFQNLGAEIVNNFGTPSIYNELAWAFGEEQFDEELNFFTIAEDKVVDLHLVNSIRPARLELVRARRNARIEAMRQLADCRILIVTLGLIELWWDEKANRYLNTTPLPSVLEKDPHRFAFHVLNFEECLEYLDRAFDVIARHCRKDLRIVLTVSPVPMLATHRPIDVITANCYSKSLLRSAAEHVVAARKNVTYFPSFETVTLSDRHAAWDDDMVHVRRSMVAYNVERMVNAYTGAAEPGTALAIEPVRPKESGEALILAEKARQARIANDAQFFERFAEQGRGSEAFLLEFARHLFDRREFSQALDMIAAIAEPEAELLRAQILIEQDDFRSALGAAIRVAETGNRGTVHWRIMLDAAVGLESIDDVLDIERRWHEAEPRRSPLINAYVVRALVRLGRYEEAKPRSQAALEVPDAVPVFAAVDYARVLVALGEGNAAITVLNTVKVSERWHAHQVETLRRRANRLLNAANSSIE